MVNLEKLPVLGNWLPVISDFMLFPSVSKWRD